MLRMTGLVAAVVLVAGFAMAAAPRQEVVQGLYEGGASPGGQKLEARLVALGKGEYKLLVRVPEADGKVAKTELAGKPEGEGVRFAGKAGAAAAWADGVVKGTIGEMAFELKRVERKSPTLGQKPPAGAIVILDGKNFDELTQRAGQEWKVTEAGAIQVPKGGMNSKRQFGTSIKVHVEFKCPLMPEADGQGRANSGSYLPNGQEIQVLDSFGMTTYTGGGCGGLYRYKDPDAFDEFSLASLPPLEWQTYDIEYRVKTEGGRPVGKPVLTVYHNGIKIHDAVELNQNARVGGLHWQDHGNAVEYRNIWVVEME